MYALAPLSRSLLRRAAVTRFIKATAASARATDAAPATLRNTTTIVKTFLKLRYRPIPAIRFASKSKSFTETLEIAIQKRCLAPLVLGAHGGLRAVACCHPVDGRTEIGGDLDVTEPCLFLNYHGVTGENTLQSDNTQVRMNDPGIATRLALFDERILIPSSLAIDLSASSREDAPGTARAPIRILIRFVSFLGQDCVRITCDLRSSLS